MAKDARVRLFTVEEANHAIKELRRTLPAMRRAVADLQGLEDRLSILDLICDRSVASENPDLREYLSTKTRYHRRVSDFERLWKTVEDSGYLLRDLERGIVHFPSLRGEEMVVLCWCEGESEVAHWHAADGRHEDAEREEI
ncbi:MAG: DUF2203 family protein [Gemmatimonadetes bacterium]|nr:DUF2203 family protein [Gemmatimonadota bacterium]